MSKTEFHEKRLATIKEGLSQTQLNLLTDLYYYRMMTYQTALTKLEQDKIEELVEKKLIIHQIEEDWEKNEEEVLYLTQDGVGIVCQHCQIGRNELNDKDSIVVRRRFKASELREKKPKEIRNLLENTRFFEAVEQALKETNSHHTPIRWKRMDKKFHQMRGKQEEDYRAQAFPSDQVLWLNECEVHFYDASERLTKIEWWINNRIKPFLNSSAYTYLEHPILVIFTVSSRQEAKKYREIALALIGDQLSQRFNLLITTRKEAIRYMTKKFIPELVHFYHFIRQVKKEINREQMIFAPVKEEIQKRVVGRYEGMASYQGQAILLLDNRFKDLLTLYTMNNHLSTQVNLKTQIRVMVYDNDKLSLKDRAALETNYIHCVSKEKLKEEDWIKKAFVKPLNKKATR